MRHLLIFDTANAEMLKRVIRLLLLLFFKGKGFRPLKLTFLIASFLCYCYEQNKDIRMIQPTVLFAF